MEKLLGLIAAALTIRACWIETFGSIPLPKMPQVNFLNRNCFNRKNQKQAWEKLLKAKRKT